jgi:hypothetical protein
MTLAMSPRAWAKTRQRLHQQQETTMERKDAVKLISVNLDGDGMPCKPRPSESFLVGWDSGFEPLFVAVRFGDGIDTFNAAIEVARDFLRREKWFSYPQEKNEPDYVFPPYSLGSNRAITRT